MAAPGPLRICASLQLLLPSRLGLGVPQVPGLKGLCSKPCCLKSFQGGLCFLFLATVRSLPGTHCKKVSSGCVWQVAEMGSDGRERRLSDGLHSSLDSAQMPSGSWRAEGPTSQTCSSALSLSSGGTKGEMVGRVLPVGELSSGLNVLLRVDVGTLTVTTQLGNNPRPKKVKSLPEGPLPSEEAGIGTWPDIRADSQLPLSKHS